MSDATAPSPTPLDRLGYTSLEPPIPSVEREDGCRLARVIAVHRERYTIHDGYDELPAEVTGRLMNAATAPADFPTVGDWVYLQRFGDDMAIIHEVLPRRTFLQRRSAGKRVDIQAIAANIDTAFIVQGLDGNVNLRRLERYLAISLEAGIEPVVLLSKRDLVAETDLAEWTDAIRRDMPDLPVLPVSGTTGAGLDAIRERFSSGRTFCLLGSSGVGKTTLLNALIGTAAFETATVRRGDHKGRHTTTRRQLVMLPDGALIIDTPGMRELGTVAVESGIDDAFPEIRSLTGQCRFADCSHGGEAGCAVTAAVTAGEISPERLESYRKLQRESERNAMTIAERRRRDKELGKLYKSIMKGKEKK